MSISQIGRVLGIARNTVRAALVSDAPPKHQRKPAGSIVDAVGPRIRELLRAFQGMPATVIAERIGWTHSIRVLSGRVAVRAGLAAGRSHAPDARCSAEAVAGGYLLLSPDAMNE